MKELEKKFTGKGSVKDFEFVQEYADDYGYIYKVLDTYGKTWYEVFERRIVKALDTIIGGNEVHFDDRVLYPTDNSFGIWAWTFSNYQKAYDMLGEIKKRIIQREVNAKKREEKR